MANYAGNKRKNDMGGYKNSKESKSSGGFKKSKSSAPDVSNLSSSKQKRAMKHERQSHRRHADVVKESKELWSQLRLKTNTEEQTKPLMEKMMELLFNTESTVSEIALQHDASRTVQAAIQFATPEQRRKICKALAPQLPEISKVQYAHFCVLKLIQYGHRDEECVKILVKSMKGRLCKMAVHAVGARVVELLFSTIPSKHTNVLRQEFYGPHFSLFADTVANKTPTLQSNIDAQPDKKEPACNFVLNNLIQKGLNKGLFGFAYFQQLLAEYCNVVGGSEMRSEGLISSLVDHSLHLLSTRPGTQVVVRCIAHGSAKDRKRILKSLKGYARSSLMHRDAYLAILQVVLVTDDTVSVHKGVLAELLTAPPVLKKSVDDEEPGAPNHPLLELALDDHASRLLLLLAIDDEDIRNKYLDPLERELLQTNPTVIENGEEVPTSKKNPATRRKELLQYVQKPFMDLCLQHTAELTRSLPGSRVMQQVYNMSGSTSDELKEALVQLSIENDAMETDDKASTSLLEDPVGHYLIKHLVTENADFAEALADALDMDNIESSRAAFVVTALCKSDQRDKVVKAVKKPKLKKLLAAKKKEKVATAGFEALLKALDEKQ